MNYYCIKYGHLWSTSWWESKRCLRCDYARKETGQKSPMCESNNDLLAHAEAVEKAAKAFAEWIRKQYIGGISDRTRLLLENLEHALAASEGKEEVKP